MSAISQSCSSCRLATYCFPPGINEKHLHLLDSLVNKQKLFHRNEFIYKENARFTHIYVIRSGSVKTYHVAPDGTEVITGFFYPGELLGLNAIAPEHYIENVLALDTVSVCALNYAEFESLSTQFAGFNKQLIKLMSEKMATSSIINLTCSAESKLAVFLLTISKKMKNYGTSGVDFSLSMSRVDIAKYLGLASETVSRILSKFQVNSLLSYSNKNIQLKDLVKLEELAAQAFSS